MERCIGFPGAFLWQVSHEAIVGKDANAPSTRIKAFVTIKLCPDFQRFSVKNFAVHGPAIQSSQSLSISAVVTNVSSRIIRHTNPMQYVAYKVSRKAIKSVAPFLPSNAHSRDSLFVCNLNYVSISSRNFLKCSIHFV